MAERYRIPGSDDDDGCLEVLLNLAIASGGAFFGLALILTASYMHYVGPIRGYRFDNEMLTTMFVAGSLLGVGAGWVFRAYVYKKF
jgi:hypothetical protein